MPRIHLLEIDGYHIDCTFSDASVAPSIEIVCPNGNDVTKRSYLPVLEGEAVQSINGSIKYRALTASETEEHADRAQVLKVGIADYNALCAILNDDDKRGKIEAEFGAPGLAALVEKLSIIEHQIGRFSDEPIQRIFYAPSLPKKVTFFGGVKQTEVLAPN